MITGIDHIVLTVRDIEAACSFYARVLGVEVETFGAARRALKVGGQKINLQTLGQETRNHAAIGCGDLCLLTALPAAALAAHLAAERVAIVEGPVTQQGARGAMRSIYFNDPDGNLIEVASYSDGSPA